MAAHQRARRLLTAIGAAGLAYPACAAICPKGRSGCPYPGHCFLYTDADANSLCDYTSRSAGVAEEPAGTAVTAPTTAGTPVSATTAVPALPSAPGSTAVELAPVSAVLAGLAVFLVTAAAFFALIRTGRLGGRAAGPPRRSRHRLSSGSVRGSAPPPSSWASPRTPRSSPPPTSSPARSLPRTPGRAAPSPGVSGSPSRGSARSSGSRSSPP